MAVWSNSWQGAGIPTTFQIGAVGFVISQVTVYNNTPAQITISEYQLPFGSTQYIIPAFYPIRVPVGNWNAFSFATDGTVPFTNSSLLIVATDSPLAGDALSPFGPSGWGAGAGPGSLTQITPGNPILAWNINQVIQYLEGLISGTLIINGGGIFTGQVQSQGTVAGFRFFDRDGVGSDSWLWFANTGNANLFSSVLGASVFSLDELGNVTVFGKLSAANLQSSGFVAMSKIAAPATDANHGQLYVSTDGHLHYLGTAGTDTVLANP